MIQARPRFAGMTAIACAILCTSLLAAAAQIDAPTSGRSLLLPPPQSGFLPRAQAAIRAEFAALLDAPRSEPMLLNVLLNNDFTLDVAIKQTLAPGTTLDAASPRDAPNNGFTPAQLDPADPRWVGRLALDEERADSQPLFINFAVRGVSKTRSASVVEPTIKAKFPQLYDAEPDGKMLVRAFFADDGTLKHATHSAYTSDESLAGRSNQVKYLVTGGITERDVGTTSVIGGSQIAPYKPTILYGFEKSKDPSVDAHPLSPETPAQIGVQRALVERHFPRVAAESPQPHELLWMLLNTAGEVVRTGRTTSNPEELAESIDAAAPDTDIFVRRTKAVGDLFGHEVLDVQRQPVLVSFLWASSDSDSTQTNTAADVLVDSNIYRNDQIVRSAPLSLSFGKRYASEITDALRVEIFAVDLNETTVELRLRVQARAESKSAEYADPWETASEPVLRTKYGKQSVVELGIQYPGSSDVAIWRLELTPKRAAG